MLHRLRIQQKQREECRLPLLSPIKPFPESDTFSTQQASFETLATETMDGSWHDDFFAFSESNVFRKSRDFMSLGENQSESDNASLASLFHGPSLWGETNVSSDDDDDDDDTSLVNQSMTSDIWTTDSAVQLEDNRNTSLDSSTIFDEVSAIYSHSSDHPSVAKNHPGPHRTHASHSTPITHDDGYSMLDPQQRLGGGQADNTVVFGPRGGVEPNGNLTLPPSTAVLEQQKQSKRDKTNTTKNFKHQRCTLLECLFGCFRQRILVSPSTDDSLVPNDLMSMSTLTATPPAQWI